MKILIIAPMELPVPAVDGGAVETLLTHILTENEKHKNLDINIITCYSDSLNKKYCEFNHTNFFCKNFSNNGFLFFLKPLIGFSIVKRLYNKVKRYLYNKHIIKILKDNNFDFIITEGGNYHSYSKIYDYIPFDKSILHIHSSAKCDEFCERNYKYFIELSEYALKYFLINAKVNEKNVFLINNCVPGELFLKRLSKLEYDKVRSNYNIEKNDRIILYCGRLVKEKGIKELLYAFKKISNKPNLKLLIVGNATFGNNEKTEYENELLNICNELKDKIIFTGYIPNQELYKIYQISDLSVFPHIWEEGFGLTVVESMISGLPIIATNSGAIPDLLKDYDGYTVIEKENKEVLIDQIAHNIIKYINNIDFYKEKCKKRVKMIAEKYSVEEYYFNYVNVLKECNKSENRNNNISKCT